MTRAIGFLIYPGFQILDAAGPVAAFEMASRFGDEAYGLRVLAPGGGLVASSAGVVMQAEAMETAPPIDTLIVAGGRGEALLDPRLHAYIRDQSIRTRRIASVCSGAVALAEAGLLDGKRATTHWAITAFFERRYPKVRLEADRIFVREGSIWTSAGITAGIDLTLALIAEDLGEAVARRAAQQLVVFHRRPGGQSQFSALLEIERPRGRFATLLSWARERLHEPLGVERLAAQAAMSPRNFARAFAAEIGVTPARAVEQLRVDAARARVESDLESIDVIARTSGFGDAERMRRAFVRAFGQPPQAIRRAARS